MRSMTVQEGRSTTPQNPVAVRLTVPLRDTSIVDDNGYLFTGRMDITSKVALAALDDHESARLERVLGGSYRCRLEIHDYPLIVNHDTWLDPKPIEVVRHHLALLSCAIRVAPRWDTVVADAHNGQHWQRMAYFDRAHGGSPRRGSLLFADRLRTWSTLLQRWPSNLPEQVGLALTYYVDSIGDFRYDNAKSLLSAATALETLIAGDLREAIARAISQRGAFLVARDADALALSRQIKKWYRARSELTHAGKSPALRTLVELHRYLMRAIPSMAALVSAIGSSQQARDTLDDATFVRRPELEALFTGPDPWWAYVPVATMLDGDTP
jgi:hypothetical protein